MDLSFFVKMIASEAMLWLQPRRRRRRAGAGGRDRRD
jgi:hypothetical protein